MSSEDVIGLHLPAVTSAYGERWSVYCLACSEAEQEWVYPCAVLEWTPEPPETLVPPTDD